MDVENLLNFFAGDFETMAVYLYLRYRGDGFYSLREMMMITGYGREKLKTILCRLLQKNIISFDIYEKKGIAIRVIEKDFVLKKTELRMPSTVSAIKDDHVVRSSLSLKAQEIGRTLETLDIYDKNNSQLTVLNPNVQCTLSGALGGGFDDLNDLKNFQRDTERKTAINKQQAESSKRVEHNPPRSADGSLFKENPTPKKPKQDPRMEEIRLAWNEAAEEHNLPKVRKIDKKREKRLKELLKEEPDVAFWKEVFAKVNQSYFLVGSNARGWRANFDFVLRDGNLNKIYEGHYNESQYKYDPSKSVHFKPYVSISGDDDPF